MLKKRIIPALLIKGSSIVKSIRFDEHRIVGDFISTSKVFSKRFADEMFILDIDAYKNSNINYSNIFEISKFCNMPLTVGGGIKKFEHAKKLFENGADKVVIRTSYFENQNIIKDIAKYYGNQSVIVCMDIKLNNSKLMMYDNNSLNFVDPFNEIKNIENLGAGEILINFVDLDGTMNGFDINFLDKMNEKTKIPLIAMGGCGSKKDFLNAFNTGVAAVAAGSIFFWIGETIISIKEYLDKNGINVRLN